MNSYRHPHYQGSLQKDTKMCKLIPRFPKIYNDRAKDASAMKRSTQHDTINNQQLQQISAKARIHKSNKEQLRHQTNEYH